MKIRGTINCWTSARFDRRQLRNLSLQQAKRAAFCRFTSSFHQELKYYWLEMIMQGSRSVILCEIIDFSKWFYHHKSWFKQQDWHSAASGISSMCTVLRPSIQCKSTHDASLLRCTGISQCNELVSWPYFNLSNINLASFKLILRLGPLLAY